MLLHRIKFLYQPLAEKKITIPDVCILQVQVCMYIARLGNLHICAAHSGVTIAMLVMMMMMLGPTISKT